MPRESSVSSQDATRGRTAAPTPLAETSARRGRPPSPGGRRRERGAVALEFAVIVLPFLTVVFGIVILSFLFVAQSLLDNAARDAARMIRIGLYTGSGYQASLKAQLCGNELSLGNFSLIHHCTQNLLVRVVAAPTGSPAGSGFWNLTTVDFGSGGTQEFDALGPKNDVVLQIGYPFATFARGYTPTLMSTMAFQTEPY